MNRQLELDIDRPAWHDSNYESSYTKSWAERANQFAQADDKKTSSEIIRVHVEPQSEPYLK